MRKGSHVSDEQRARMSAAQKGRTYTEEHKRNLAASIKRSWENPDMKASRSGKNHYLYGKHLDPETIEKMRKSKEGQNVGSKNPMYGKHHPEETRKKIGDTRRGKKLAVPKTAETRAKHSAALSGKKKSLTHIEKQSATMMGRYAGSRNPMYGKRAAHSWGEWFALPNGDRIWLRSSYEIRVVTALTRANIAWEYEPEIFTLPNMDATYCPDFYLPDYNIWWEVKGYWRGNALERVMAFVRNYPDKTLKILYKNDIYKLEQICECADICQISTLGDTLKCTLGLS